MSPTPWRKERHTIECCKDCKPPKRYPGCGGTCKEYKEEKAKYLEDKQKEKEYLKNHPAIEEYDFNRVRSTASRKK